MTICERKSGGRILCIRLSGLGDIVHAMNALTLLRRERPDAFIAWAVEERSADILREHPLLDRVIVVPRKSWSSMLRRPGRWKDLIADFADLWGDLRKLEFDASVDFQSSLKSAWIVLAAGAPLRVGFGPPVSRELNRHVQSTLVSCPAEGIHRIERDLALLAPLGIRTRFAPAELPTWRPEREAVDLFLRGLDGSGPIVVMHPGTSAFAAFKRWMPSRYAQVADRLVAERDARVVVSHGPGEEELANAVLSSMKQPGHPAPHVGGLRGLVELLRPADLFIGSDTGPMHIASTLGVRTLALFGPKDPAQTGPYGSRSLVVTGSASCRPCTRRRCSHVRCMTSIGPETVYQAARRLLDAPKEADADERTVKKPMTWPFSLGDWEGVATTCYSSPEFYTWLCSSEGARHLEPSEQGCDLVTTADVPVGGTQVRISIERHPPHDSTVEDTGLVAGRRVRRAWRAALRLTSAGVSVPFPVARMSKTRHGRGARCLLTDRASGVVTLRQWLRRDEGRRWARSSGRERSSLLTELARTVQVLHAAGYRHTRLDDSSILIDGSASADTARFFFAELDRVRCIAWLPYFIGDLLRGLDLRRLLIGFNGAFSRRDRIRFLRAYCDGYADERHRRRVLIGIALRR